jgi:hypothetical protein
MKNCELIEKLQQFDADLEVVLIAEMGESAATSVRLMDEDRPNRFSAGTTHINWLEIS